MNKHFKTLFSGFIALCCAMILTLGCSSPSTDSGDPSERAVIDSRLGTFKEKSNDSAANIVYNMGFGWNLGNTFDAANGSAENGYTSNSFENAGVSSENAWSQPTTTQSMIKALKKAGIRTIRIPISWHNHITNSNYDIDSAWMNRVKTVVDWAIDEGLYVIINVHHDNVGSGKTTAYGNGYCPSTADKTNSETYLTKVWTQICTTFKNYDNHLIFESINEPRLIGETHEWNWDASCSECSDAMARTVEYNQLIVDTIRASGGKNATRLIMVPSYVASPDAAFKSEFSMPNDTANMLALSVHMYSPYDFAMGYPGSKEFTSSHKSTLTYYFDKLQTQFINKGYPVIIGEMGATNKNNLSAREAWFTYFVEEARKKGMCPVLWDNNSNTIEKANGNGSEVYGFFNRSRGTWYFPTLIENAVTATYKYAETQAAPSDPASGSEVTIDLSQGTVGYGADKSYANGILTITKPASPAADYTGYSQVQIPFTKGSATKVAVTFKNNGKVTMNFQVAGSNPWGSRIWDNESAKYFNANADYVTEEFDIPSDAVFFTIGSSGVENYEINVKKIVLK